MRTQTITLSIPEEVLREARRLAEKRGTSLEKLLIQILLDVIQANDEYERARSRHLAILERSVDLGTGGEAASTRDALHERRSA